MTPDFKYLTLVAPPPTTTSPLFRLGNNFSNSSFVTFLEYSLFKKRNFDLYGIYYL